MINKIFDCLSDTTWRAISLCECFLTFSYIEKFYLLFLPQRFLLNHRSAISNTFKKLFAVFLHQPKWIIVFRNIYTWISAWWFECFAIFSMNGIGRFHFSRHLHNLLMISNNFIKNGVSFFWSRIMIMVEKHFPKMYLLLCYTYLFFYFYMCTWTTNST